VRFLRFSHDKKVHGPLARSWPPSEHPANPAQESAPRRDSDDALALARTLHRAGLGSVAAFALDVLKPLHWIGGQAVWVLQPFIAGLGAGSRRGASMEGLSSSAVARLLERDGGLDDLVFHLERLQRESREGSGTRP